MKEVLGIFVLASPFSFIIFVIAISIIVTLLFSKDLFGNKRNYIGAIAIVVLTYFGVTGQELIGRTYHDYLCENKAGWNNYTKIKLSASFWNENGSPKFVDKDNKINHKMINPWFTTGEIDMPVVGGFIKINKHSFAYYDKENNKVAEKIDFTRYYGWTNEYSLAPNISEGCNTVLIRKHGRAKYKKQYKQKYNDFILNLFTK